MIIDGLAGSALIQVQSQLLSRPASHFHEPLTFSPLRTSD